MTIWRFSKNVTGAILGSALIVLLAAGTGFAYWSINRTLDAFRWVDHTLEVRIELEHLLAKSSMRRRPRAAICSPGNDVSLNIFEPSLKDARSIRWNPCGS